MDCLLGGKNRISPPLLINLLLTLTLLSQSCRANLPPYFTDDLNNHVISENTPVGTAIYTLKAVDPEKSELKFGIMGTDKLVVNEKTGVVTISKPIDREIADQLKVTVTVEDVVGDGLADNNLVTVPVSLLVSDENDNTVEFLNQSGYESLEVIENAPIGHKVLSINLRDPDMTGMELSVKCSAMPQSPEACDVFQITTQEATSGYLKAEMRLGEKLNYNKRSLYQLMLTASDGEHVSKAGVLIRIKDVQNTAPVFVGAMSGRIMEDAAVGSLVMIIEAKDGDMGKPRDVRLTLLSNPGDSFHLDSTSGHLTTTRPLDREMFGSLLFLGVKAQELPRSDEPPLVSLADIDILQTIANVSVLIDDVNDFAPTFNKREFFADIFENTPVGTPIPDLDIVVTDKDSGTFADFSLRIEGYLADFFDIEPKFATGSARPTIRLKKSFDYENPNERKFIILILAQNVEEPELFSTCSVTLSIQDLNDCKPIFSQDVYTLTVPELAKPGSKIGSITATDRDSREFGTEGLIYQLVGAGHKKFSVNSKSGDISVAECPSVGNNNTVTTSNCLDYETQKTYDLLYMASDSYKTDGFIHSIVPVQILLTDQNDNPPSMPRHFHRTILENTRQFEPGFFIRANDVDKTALLSYKMTELPGTPPKLFKLDENTAELYIKSPALPPGNYSLHVEATDGVYKSTTSVNITVLDINNHSPSFKEPMKRDLRLPEDSDIGTIVSTLVATDLDFDQNGEIRYRIEKGGFGYFDLDEVSGELVLTKELDFSSKSEFELLVSAGDLGVPPLRTLTIVNIKVVQVFFPLPKINPIVQRAQISESAGIGELVTKILVEHESSERNLSSLDLRFQFVEPIEIRNSENKAVTDIASLPDWFQINNNGEVVVTTHIVRAMAVAMNLTVMLTSEKARPGSMSLGTLMLTVFEVNNQPPRIEDVEIETYEELPPGMTIITLSAEDPDGGHISEYRVDVGEEYVSVDNKTGEIKVAGRLDYETKPVYNVTIIAVDSGVPPLSSTGTILINLLNINDNPPSFTENSYEGEVLEHSPEGTVILSVAATDPDGDVLAYEIEPGEFTSAFRVDRLGQLTVTKEGVNILDRETLPSPYIKFGIRAKDSEHIGYGNVIVKVLDINDVWPKMEQKSYHVVLHAPVRSTQEILRINANGGDHDGSDEIRFKIQSGNDIGLFEIDQRQGILSSSRAYEETGEFRLVVEVTDRKSNTSGLDHYDRAGVFVQILPGNFRKPEFKFPNKVNSTLPALESDNAERVLFMGENYSKILGQAIAHDSDDGEAGVIQYYFKEGDNLVTETEQFRIETDSGMIHQIKPLDREKMNRYNLVVIAKDGGIPISAQTSQMLTVEVEDLNDHSAVFVQKQYNFSIVENSLENTFVGGVLAVDEDEGRHAQIFYFIVALEKNKHYIHNDLRIDIKSGAIITNTALDHERVNSYDFFVRASDSPMANKSMEVMNILEAQKDPSMCLVHIKVIDLNDNPPAFARKQYYAGINSEAEPGREILTFESTDVDPSSQDFIQYSLLGANLILDDFKPGGSVVPSPFRVDQNTGRLTISPAAMRQFAGGTNRFMVKVGVKETIPPYHQDTTQVKVWVVEKTQEAVLTIKTPPTEMLKDELIELLANITGSLVLVNKVTPHSVNKHWSDVYVTAVDKSSSQIIPVGQFLQALDLGHDRLHRKGVPMELYSAVPAMGSTERDTFFNNRESFDTAFAGLVALVALLCMGFATILAICCCLNRMYAIKKSEKENHFSGLMKYPLHPGGSIPGTPNITRNILSQKQPEMIEDLATDNPLWIDHKIKSYEEQELTMQVASDLDNSNGTDDGMSMDMDEPQTLSLTRQQSPQFSHAYATLHPHPPDYDNILDDTIAIHL